MIQMLLLLFLEKYQNHKHLVIAAYMNQEPIGYMIGYEKEKTEVFMLG